MPGTEYGGVVSVLCPARTRYGDAISYKGRTWHGILEDHVICPPSGKSYLAVSGDANAVLRQLVQEMGLGDVFGTSSYAGINVVGSFRYCAGYTGIVEMLAASGARLKAAWDTAAMRCVLSAVPVRDWGDVPGVSGSTVYSAELDYRFDYQLDRHCSKTSNYHGYDVYQFDYQLDRHCSKTRKTRSRKPRGFDYQLDRHCSKTTSWRRPSSSAFDYQLDRHCSKTNTGTDSWTSRLITS